MVAIVGTVVVVGIVGVVRIVAVVGRSQSSEGRSPGLKQDLRRKAAGMVRAAGTMSVPGTVHRSARVERQGTGSR